MIGFLITFFICLTLIITMLCASDDGFGLAFITGLWCSFWASFWLMLVMVGIKYLAS